MGDHIAKRQAVKERGSRSFCWAEMRGAAFPISARAELLWCGVSEAALCEQQLPLGALSLPTSALLAAITQIKPCCFRAVRLFFHLYWLGLGLVFFSPIVSSSEWKWFAVILGWVFFTWRKKKSIYFEAHLEAGGIPNRSKECWLESIIDLLWSKWSENFAMSRNTHSVLTRQGLFL